MVYTTMEWGQIIVITKGNYETIRKYTEKKSS